MLCIMKFFNISIAERQAERLDAIVQQTGINRSEHIRRAIDLYLEKLAKTEKLLGERHADLSAQNSVNAHA